MHLCVSLKPKFFNSLLLIFVINISCIPRDSTGNHILLNFPNSNIYVSNHRKSVSHSFVSLAIFTEKTQDQGI